MQVNAINNQTNNNQNFTAYRTDIVTKHHLVKSFRDNCTSVDLLKILQAVRSQEKISTHINIRSVDSVNNPSKLGFIEAEINGSIYENGNLTNTKPWQIRRFITNLAKLAEKDNQNPLPKIEKRKIKKENKKELEELQTRFLFGEIREKDLKEEFIQKIFQYINVS